MNKPPNQAFPGVAIVGDGYTNPEVQKAVGRAAEEVFKCVG
jgi:hypothetical protein